MSKRTNDDPRNLQAIAPDEHKDREGATEWSGFQPAEKHSRQGSEPYNSVEDVLKSSARSGVKKK